jgi:hypothetical protein
MPGLRRCGQCRWITEVRGTGKLCSNVRNTVQTINLSGPTKRVEIAGRIVLIVSRWRHQCPKTRSKERILATLVEVC